MSIKRHIGSPLLCVLHGCMKQTRTIFVVHSLRPSTVNNKTKRVQSPTLISSLYIFYTVVCWRYAVGQVCLSVIIFVKQTCMIYVGNFTAFARYGDAFTVKKATLLLSVDWCFSAVWSPAHMDGEAGCYFLDSREERGESAQTTVRATQKKKKKKSYLHFFFSVQDNKELKAHKCCMGMICCNSRNKKHKWELDSIIFSKISICCLICLQSDHAAACASQQLWGSNAVIM